MNGNTIHFFTEEEKAFIINNYGKISYLEMMKTIDKPYWAITRFTRTMGITTPRSVLKQSRFSGVKAADVDENFFELPSCLSAYYAGFIAADGNVATINEKNKVLSIGLAIKDLAYLEEFQRRIFYRGKICIKDYPYYYKGEKRISKGCKLAISNVKIVNDLSENYGIYPRKSLTIQFPNKLIDANFIDAFIAGYIDGDGCIRREKYALHISVLGTESMTSWILNRFKSILKKDLPPKANRKFGKIYNMTIIGNNAKHIFLHYYRLIQQYNLPALKRKWKDEHYGWVLKEGFRRTGQSEGSRWIKEYDP